MSSCTLVNQWEEKRKKAVLREFYKDVQKEQQNSVQDSLNINNATKDSEITRYVQKLFRINEKCLIHQF